MSNRHHAVDWWKNVPCHFIWKLEENVHVDFKAVVNNLDSKLETRNEIEWTESACDILLFRGYIEVSKFEGVQNNPTKAEEFFLEAEKEAMKVTDDDERHAYITVVMANSLWVLETCQEEHQDELGENRRSKLMTELEASWCRERDELGQKKFDAFIDGIVAFALGRLGPNKYKEAERRYQGALTTITNKSSWYNSLGTVIGRQGRLKVESFEALYEGINDEIQCYERSIELDPQNSSAKCDLATVLLRFPERKDEARDLMKTVDENSCEMITKKGTFYRRMGDFEMALQILRKGEKLQHPRSYLYFGISCVYKHLSIQAKSEGKRSEKMKNDRNELEYLDKCLELEPSHFAALEHKGVALSKVGKKEESIALLRRVIEEFKSFPDNFIEAQYVLANTLFIHNNKTCNAETARAYEDVVDTAISLMKTVHLSGNRRIRTYLMNAKEKLEKYYGNVNGGNTKILILRNRLSEIGFDG